MHDNANAGNIGKKIRERLSEVWDYIHMTGSEHFGQNVSVYFDYEDQLLFLSDPSVPVEFSVLVKQNSPATIPFSVHQHLPVLLPK